MKLSKKQREYWIYANKRWNIKYGATRSGKTFIDYYIIPRRIRSCGSGRIVLIGNTRNTIERNILEPMRSMYGEKLVGNIGSNSKVRLFGRSCHVLGADKVSQVSKLQGASISYCYGDEITTWNKEVFEMLKSRLSEPDSIFDGTCNPDSPRHWMKEFLDGPAEIFEQHYEIDDNPFLTEDFKRNLKQEYKGTVYYDRFILGRWVAAEGVIYRQFADTPSRFLTKDDSGVGFAVIGIDFGGNMSAHAFVCVGFSYDMRQVTVLDEYYKKKMITPKDLEDDFLAFVIRNKEKYPIYEARCDSAETTLIRGLAAAVNEAGIAIDVKKALKGPINDRIRFVNMMMSLDRFKIMQHCEHLQGALQEAVWDDKSIADKRLDDGKLNVDSLDAMEYALEPYIRDMTEMSRMR